MSATTSNAARTSQDYKYISGPRQWLRKSELILRNRNDEKIDLSNLRFTFKLAQSELQSPNTAWIRVYNPSPETAKLVQREFTRVALSAGYQEGNYGIIFDGEVKQVRIGRENSTDTYLEIAAADGDVAYNFSVVNITLAAGSGPLEVIRAAAAAMAGEPFNITLGPIPEDLPPQRLARGRVLFGMAREVLRQIANLIDCDWSILNRVLTFTPRKGYVEGDIIVLTARSGLVGLPEQTQDGVQARCLLNPRILIGRRVMIDNKSVQQTRFDLSYTGEVRNSMIPKISADGLYRVLSIDYAGDTRGQEWYCDLVLLTLDPTSPQPIAQVARGRFTPEGSAP